MAGQPRTGLAGAFHNLALLAALIGTVFTAPRLWPLAEAKVWDWLIDLYSFETTTWLHLGCETAAWLLVFLAIRAGLLALFTAVAFLLAKWAM